MYKIIFTLSLLWLSTISLTSQFYEKIFDLRGNSFGWRLKKAQNRYLLTGIVNPYNSGTSGQDVFLLDFNENGPIVESKIFSTPSRDDYPLLTRGINSNFLTFFSNFGSDYSYIQNLDNNRITKYDYGDTEVYSVFSDDDNIYLVGNNSIGSSRGMFQKYNSDLQSIFTYQYTANTTNHVTFHLVTKLSNSNIAISGSVFQGSSRKSILVILDSTGTVLNSKVIDFGSYNDILSATQLSNGNIVNVGFSQGNGFAFEVKENGDLVKVLQLRSKNQRYNLSCVVPHGNKYYLIGNLETNTITKGLIVLVDENGKIEKKLEYYNNKQFNTLNDAVNYNNSEIILCGSVYLNGIQKCLFIKTDVEFSTCTFINSNEDLVLEDVTSNLSYNNLTMNKSSMSGSRDFQVDETISQTTSITNNCQIVVPFQCGTGSFEWEKIASKYADFNFIRRSAFRDSTIYLTDNNFAEVGSVWSKQRKYVTKGFRTNFTFSMSQGSNYSSVDGSDPGADGIVFILQNNTNTDYGPSGGALGYEDIPNALAFEFDTFNNPVYNDPNGNHFAIQTSKKGKISMIHNAENTLFINDKIPLLEQNKKYTCQIEYLEDLKTLTVYLDTREDLATKKEIAKLNNFKLEDHINLTGGRAYVGFTSSTGTATENHKINNWDLCLLGEDPDIQSDVLMDEETNNNIDYDEIRVFNLLGKELLQLNTFEELNQNISKFNSGIYFATKYLKGKFISSQKVIKN